MNPQVALIIATAITAVGWISTTIFTFGKLHGTVQRHEMVLTNGIVKEISDLKAQVAGLDGTIKTYIDLTKGG